MAGKRILFSRFISDRSGVAAVEFVLVVPLIILLYLGAVELSMGLEVDKNVSRASGIIADIVAQQPVITKAQLEDIAKIGAATLFPYDRTKPGIRITAIQVADTNQPNPSATVAWSYGEGGLTGNGQGTKIDLPASLRAQGAFLIKVDVALSYVPITTWGLRNIAAPSGSMPLSETYYLGPRMSNAIVCTTC